MTTRRLLAAAVLSAVVGAALLVLSVPWPFGANQPGPMLWSELSLENRLNAATLLLSFFGLLAAVLAIWAAVAEIGEVFPEQRILTENRSESDEDGSYIRLWLGVPQRGAIVNAFRFELSINTHDDHQLVTLLRNRNQPWIYAFQTPNPFWRQQEDDDRNHEYRWTAERDERIFPGLGFSSPRVATDTLPDRPVCWRGTWWTDRNGPVDFHIVIDRSNWDDLNHGNLDLEAEA